MKRHSRRPPLAAAGSRVESSTRKSCGCLMFANQGARFHGTFVVSLDKVSHSCTIICLTIVAHNRSAGGTGSPLRAYVYLSLEKDVPLHGPSEGGYLDW